jgi:hypothetical protein
MSSFEKNGDETGELLIALPHRMTMFVGMAWLPEGAEVTPDDEHDAYAWWPPDPVDWPDEAHPQLRRMASMFRSGTSHSTAPEPRDA